MYESKYFKNKHFFLDPFALTIAQWCYIKLNSQNSRSATPASARTLLENEGHLEEIQSSFWRYVCVWGEKGEWESWKEKIANGIVELDSDGMSLRSDTPSGSSDRKQNAHTPTEDDENIIAELCNRDWYDPLQDTRPYYYATYNDVRGVGIIIDANEEEGIYVKNSSGTTINLTTSTAVGTYTIEGKDEFQMRGRNISGTTSFMDILNNNVVFQTQKRIYRNCDYDSRNTGPADEVTSGHPQGIGLVNYYKSLLDSGTPLDDIPGAEYDEFGESPLAKYLMMPLLKVEEGLIFQELH